MIFLLGVCLPLFALFSISFGSIANSEWLSPKWGEDGEEWVIMDADYCADDSVVLAYLSTELERVKLIAITVVYGNLAANITGPNALRTAKFLNLKVPIYYGAEKPIEPPFQEIPVFELYGTDGVGGASANYLIGDYEYDASMKAHEAIVKLVNEYPGKISILATGPLTNLALALKQDPNVLSKVRRLFVMGGNIRGRGNAYHDRPSAGEFNFAMDPEAARMVLLGNPDVTEIYPWETCQEFGIPWKTYDEAINYDTKLSKFFKDYTLEGALAFQNLGQNGFQICDLLAAFAFAHYDDVILRTSFYNATVETKGIYTNGMMVLQDVSEISQSNVLTIDAIDEEGQNYYLLEFLKN